MAHSPCHEQIRIASCFSGLSPVSWKGIRLIITNLLYLWLCTLGLDSCNAGRLSPSPAGAVSRPLLPPLAGRRCGSFSPHGSDAQPLTSPVGSSGYGLRQHPPKGIMILNTVAGLLTDKMQPMVQLMMFFTFLQGYHCFSTEVIIPTLLIHFYFSL